MTEPEERRLILSTIHEFVERDVIPVASELEHKNEYPHELVERMKELGLFGANVPREYGGIDLDITTYAMIFEEISRGWMSVAGILGTHSVTCDVIKAYGTEEQKRRFLPVLAQGEKRAGLALTEAEAGSDVQNIKTTAVRKGDRYLLNGSKMWITNGRYGELFLLLARTDTSADPPFKGMSAFIVEKGPGFQVVRDIDKLGYKGVETCELAFDDLEVPAENLVGGVEGAGFGHIMTGLEAERINVAARAVGIARAAFEEAIRYSQLRRTFGKPICQHQSIQNLLADMATKIEAAKLLTYNAAEKKDRGERCDLEAGMAKLFATETAQEVAFDAMRVFGGNGYSTDFPIERFYRDTPLLVIGGGTSEIQRLVIARNLIEKYRVQ